MLDTKIGLFFKQRNTLWGIFILAAKLLATCAKILQI